MCDNLAPLSKNLVSPVTPGFKRLKGVHSLVFSGPSSHPLISETIGPIFAKFSGLVALREFFIEVHLFCDPSTDVVMATKFVEKFAKLPTTLFGTMAFRNALQDCNFDFRQQNIKFMSNTSLNFY